MEDDPILFVQVQNAMSASQFGGGTANLSSSLDAGQVYTN